VSVSPGVEQAHQGAAFKGVTELSKYCLWILCIMQYSAVESAQVTLLFLITRRHEPEGEPGVGGDLQEVTAKNGSQQMYNVPM
jgi:hypothetical protein